ncbi:SBBP repeat-containing protein [Sorangium sp. So ce1078]|uniref:SBBP repeat-containing protein n=1 Tax=Sorangium sp. So ce1078 TaxID=3133329 RepID=UPI003F628328
MRRSGFLALSGALGVAGALGGCFDKGVIAANTGGGGAAQGGMGGDGGDGDGGDGGVGAKGGGGATSTTSTSMEPCEPCYEGPPLTEDVGTCKSGCLRDGSCVDQVVPTAEGCATMADDESCDGEPRCTGALEWRTKIGQDGDQHGEDITFDRAGNLLVAGRFSGSVDFAESEGSTDGFVVKLDPSGGRIWAKAFGGSGTDICTRVAYAKNDIVVLAGTYENTLYFDGTSLPGSGSTDVFVAKLDEAGDLDWIKSISGPGADTVHGLSVDADDNIVVAGSFTDRADVLGPNELDSFGGEDIFVAKMDALGNHIWSKNFGNPSPQVALDAAVTPDGGVVMVGSIAGAASFGDIRIIPRGYDAFMVKLDKDGVPRIAKTFGDDMSQEFVSVAVDAQGGIYVAGRTNGEMSFDGSPPPHAGGSDAVVAAFDPEGKHRWSRQLGNAEDQLARGVAVDPAGNVLVVGQFKSAIDFEPPQVVSLGGDDAFLAKLKPDGTTAWAKSFGDAMAQGAEAVDVDALGFIALTGNFSGSIDLGGDPLTSARGLDAFVAKLQP